jgi:8-oxo-dGTP diphosphatase
MYSINMLETTSKEPEGLELIPQLTLDCVIFGFHDNALKILLLKWKGTDLWSLPGGVIRQYESLDEAAIRVLKERTGIDKIFLRQFHTFGKVQRYDKTSIQEQLAHVIDPKLWYKRAISIGYYALVDYEEVFPNPDQLSDECTWWDLGEIPKLLFDHEEILEKALRSLRLELSFQPIGLNLLPEKFTMPDMMRMYEAILGKKIDPRNFQKKILNSGIVVKLKEVKRGVAHKSPFLYKFDRKRYEEVLKEGGLFFI